MGGGKERKEEEGKDETYLLLRFLLPMHKHYRAERKGGGAEEGELGGAGHLASFW